MRQNEIACTSVKVYNHDLKGLCFIKHYQLINCCCRHFNATYLPFYTQQSIVYENYQIFVWCTHETLNIQITSVTCSGSDVATLSSLRVFLSCMSIVTHALFLLHPHKASVSRKAKLIYSLQSPSLRQLAVLVRNLTS